MTSGSKDVRRERTASPVLVGRDRELSAVLAAITRHPAVVRIEGEAGVGKTRLVGELLAHPRVDRLHTMTGHCRPLREPSPLGPVVEALRSLATLPPALTARTALTPLAGALRPLLPELGDLLPPQPEPIGDPRAELHRLLRATRELLSVTGPALLVVEDAHWADDGTGHVLRSLMSDPPSNLSVVVTCRREDFAGSAPLRSAHVPRDRAASVLLRLEPLDVHDVRRLASAILDEKAISTHAAARLHKQTAGIPFLIEELLHSRLTTSTRLLDDAEVVEVPVRLRATTAARLAALPPAARRLVHAAAVLGVPSRLEQLVTVAGVEAGHARTALTRATADGLLLEASPARYAFRHDLARQAAYDTLEGPARTRMHAAAIESLRRLDPQPLVQLAEHNRLAGRSADWMRYGEQAADRADEVGDPSVAVTLLQRLLAEPALPGPDVDRLALKLGNVAYSALEQHCPVATLNQLLIDRRLTPSARGEVRLLLGLLLIRQEGTVETGRAEIKRAIPELAERPDRAAEAAALLGLPFIGGTPLAQQQEWMAVAELHLERCTDPELRMYVRTNMLCGRMHSGDPTVLSELGTLPRSVDSVGQCRQLARAHGNLADACTLIGHFREAQKRVGIALRLATSTGSPYVVSTARSTQVRLDWYTGRWDGLADRAAQLLPDYRDLLPVASELSLVLGLLAISRGEWATARSHLELTGVTARDDAIVPVTIAGYAGLTWLWLSQDQPDRALAEVRRAVAVLRRKGVWAWSGDLLPVAVRTLLATGKRADAQALADEVAAGIGQREAPLAHAALRVAQGELAEDVGDPAAAGHYRAAQSAYQKLPAPYLATMAAERAALHRLSTGDATATEELTALADEYDRLHATRDAARCRHALRSQGGAPPSRRGRRGYGDQLSPQEEGVARLLSQGLTNREIAGVLFLSPRTVEHHVANVLRKLGATSRTELTR